MVFSLLDDSSTHKYYSLTACLPAVYLNAVSHTVKIMILGLPMDGWVQRIASFVIFDRVWS